MRIRTQEKLSIIYNNSPDRTKGIPEGYDVKALSYETDIADASKQSEQGSKKTKQITFDPANFNFTHVVISAIETVGNVAQFEPLKLQQKHCLSLIQTFSKKQQEQQ